MEFTEEEKKVILKISMSNICKDIIEGPISQLLTEIQTTFSENGRLAVPTDGKGRQLFSEAWLDVLRHSDQNLKSLIESMGDLEEGLKRTAEEWASQNGYTKSEV